MKKILIPFISLFPYFLFATGGTEKDFTKYVDPFIGTGGHGHTYPGASVPFGMVQLSPDTRLHGWDGCSAYHYSDNEIYGFSHTHLSGTGCSDYGDVLVMPTTGKPKFKHNQYASGFSHKNEKASPGYYSVKLDKYDVLAELTTTTRTGLHKYTFPKSASSNIIVDLVHRDKVLESSIEITGNDEVSGMRRSKDWADDQHVYFVMKFSKPFTRFGIAESNSLKEGLRTAKGKSLKCYVGFETADHETVMVKVGISGVSIDGARKNLEAEQTGFDFEKVRTEAVAAWNKELGKIEVESDSLPMMKVFYSAMYHAMLNPNVYQDVDGKYRGRDLKVHDAKDFTNYTVFSLWDTYRALHPLFTIIDRKRTADFINTFLVQYEQGGCLPVWELSANETGCMIGYHSVPVIADAYMKGIRDFDVKKAITAMKKSAMEDRNGLKSYKALGYIPYNEKENVSRTLEYAYDDWCIAQVAYKSDDQEDYHTFIKRAQNYKNLFDPKVGFMRGRNEMEWYSPFVPTDVNRNYTEANSWQYTFYVPQDVSGLIKLYGGKEQLASKLDGLFSADSKTTGRSQGDISGMIGQYAHGNEPSHQIAYLYDYAGQPWKTQAMVRRIMRELYLNNPNGLSGNEDCGQMSAWYIFSAMGFYPLCPAADHYAIGSPVFNKTTIHLENGKQFVITAKNVSGKYQYISSAKLNDKPYTKSYITFNDISEGGTIEFQMGQELHG